MGLGLVWCQVISWTDDDYLSMRPSVTSEWVIKFNDLLGDSGHQGPRSPYKPKSTICLWKSCLQKMLIIFVRALMYPTSFLPLSYKFAVIIQLQVFFHSPTNVMPLSYKFSAIHLQVFCHFPKSFLPFSLKFSATVLQVFNHPPTSFLSFSYKFSAILLQFFCHSPTSLLPFSYKFSDILLQVFCHYPLLTTEPDEKSFCSPPGNPTGHCSRSMCR